MATIPASSSSSSSAIVGAQFVVPHEIDLIFTKKAIGAKKKKRLAVVDLNGNLIFHVDKKKKWVLKDAADNALVTWKEKNWSLHDRREVYAGDGKNKKDLLFSVKRSTYFQFHIALDVYIAANVKEELCDYKIKGKWGKKSYILYKGTDTSVELARMYKKQKGKNMLPLGKHDFGVAISPNTDYAFVATLIYILRELHEQEEVELIEAVADIAVNVVTST